LDAILSSYLVGFSLIMTRLSGFFLFLPVFSWKAVPMRLRVATVVLLSICFTIWTGYQPVVTSMNVVQMILLLLQEATYGLALGLIVYIIFSIVKVAVRIIEREMGLAMAEIIDPLTGEGMQPLGGLVDMIFILLFLSVNGHHLLLLIITRSYETFPVGTIPSIQVMTDGLISASSIMFIAGLRMAAPMMAAFMVMLVVLGIVARVVPEMNVLFVSMPVRVGLGLIMIVVFVPFLQEFLQEFSQWMGRLLPI
jgi:flagellar biosynthetic protein FliR